MKNMKKMLLGVSLLAMSLVLVACSSGPKGTYKGKTMGVEVTLKSDGKKATMTSEANFLGMSSSQDEELTIDKKNKSMKSDKGITYDYTLDGDKLTLTAKGLKAELTKEK